MKLISVFSSLFSVVLVRVCSSFNIRTPLTLRRVSDSYKSRFHRAKEKYDSCHRLSVHVLSLRAKNICDGEVVGCTGRLGSFFLRANPNLVALPRDNVIAIGSLSPPNKPIYACVPASAIPEVVSQTLPERRNDLVWICNGLPLDFLSNGGNEEMTYSVLHFAVLTRNEDPSIKAESIPPATVLYGKHALTLKQTIFDKFNIPTQIVLTMQEIQTAAIYKLIWVCTLWLLCHSSYSLNPITVMQVHSQRKKLLKSLVDELLPKVNEMLLSDNQKIIISAEDIISYLEKYSYSMPIDTIPSKKLAMKEFNERNGKLLSSLSQDCHQSLHHELIRNVTGQDYYDDIISRNRQMKNQTNVKEDSKAIRFSSKQDGKWLQSLGNGIHFQLENEKKQTSYLGKEIRSVAIVGAGIIGSCLALSLSRNNPDLKITMFNDDDDLGQATKSSWAWLNANGKSPLHYQQLNQLGMECWKRDRAIQDLPKWCGSLLRCYNNTNPSHYIGKGPLSNQQVKELDPFAQFLSKDSIDINEGEIFYFAQEGQVNPVDAIYKIRDTAMEIGNLTYVKNTKVNKLIYSDDKQQVIGVESSSSLNTKEKSDQKLFVDLVLIAAGVGASAPELGALPMLNQPGYLAFAKHVKKNQKNGPRPQLNKILVDTINEVHMLERGNDGLLVIGGGELQVGGKSSVNTEVRDTSSSLEDSISRGRKMVDAACLLAPDFVKRSEFSHLQKGFRPIPKDGYPAVGYIQPGLYTVVTHSGITLGPLLADIVAMEVLNRVECTILKPYRPDRLF